MKRNCWCSVQLAGVNLTSYGFKIPSPFVSLELDNSQISSFTSFTLNITVGGDSTNKINVAAFEALLYSAAQAASSYPNASGIPISFSFGWMTTTGEIDTYLSYQGFTLQFKVSTNGLYMQYSIQGYASLAMECSMPVLRIPELTGIVQPSAVVEGLAKAIKADTYYELDIDHNDAPTLISHGAMTTSFISYVRGNYTGEDDYDTFPGLLKLSKSYNSSRDAAGLQNGVKKLSQVINNVSISPISNFLRMSWGDTSPQCSSFSFWVDEPTMTSPGVIHYKSNAGLFTTRANDTLIYGTVDSNILSLQGSYNGVAYNMTDMRFASVGFALDGSGSTIITDESVVNSWSYDLPDVYQSVNIINDVNAIASQFSGDFNVVIPGSVKKYSVAQPVSLLVMTGNTLSPISGVYNIVSVSHSISSTFTTTLKLQRLVTSSANQVASSQGISIRGTSSYPVYSFSTTPNVISTNKVDFGLIYPTFEDMLTDWTLLS